MSNGHRLRVMTWNLHGSKGIDQKPSIPAILEVIREADPDIAAFQEVFRLPLRDNVGALQKGLGRPLAFFPAMGLPAMGYGCALLTRETPVSQRTIPLISQGEPRMLGEAMLEIAGQQLRFLVTHLGLDPGERRRQAEEIATHMRREEVPTLLAGDFNALLDSPELQPLFQAGLVSFPQSPATFPSPAPTVALEHFFMTPHIRVERCWTLPTTASDHVPLLTELVL